MLRVESFPFDWLEPGEIRFCACGYHLQVGITCVGSFDPIARQLWEEAVIVATNRKETGFPPLFWI